MIKPLTIRLLPLLLAALILASPLPARQYEPTWESIDSRPTPSWFEDAKLGIFIHWGVYSVPAWAPKGVYSEWYDFHLNRDDGNKPEPAFREYHERIYGEDATYIDFASEFNAENWDPAAWADLFKRAGARYVVLTSKHCDGYALWPSEHAWNWNSMAVGPKRDLCGDLTVAVRDAGLKMGFYFSLWEWSNPLFDPQIDTFVETIMLPQLKDLVTRYQPDIVWGDAEWRQTTETWRSLEFLAWLFNESPVADTVAINDRWGIKTRSVHGGYFTTEYGIVDGVKDDVATGRPWEECRGIGASFGYNRNEDAEDYLTAEELVELFIDIVSNGGNLLLNVGPTADGRIPVIMQDRLLALGAWLDVNAEAIYGTRKWRVPAEADDVVRYTSSPDALYAIVTEWPGDRLVLTAPTPGDAPAAELLGHGPLPVEATPDGLAIEFPPLGPGQTPCDYAWSVKLTDVQ